VREKISEKRRVEGGIEGMPVYAPPGLAL